MSKTKSMGAQWSPSSGHPPLVTLQWSPSNDPSPSTSNWSLLIPDLKTERRTQLGKKKQKLVLSHDYGMENELASSFMKFNKVERTALRQRQAIVRTYWEYRRYWGFQDAILLLTSYILIEEIKSWLCKVMALQSLTWWCDNVDENKIGGSNMYFVKHCNHNPTNELTEAKVLAEASVRGLEDQNLWHVGGEGATLKCLSEGQPPPSYNWTRLDGPLPSGVRAKGDTLGFPRLTPEHSGIYVCHVSNEISSRDSQVTVEVLDPQDPGKQVDLVSASVVVVGVIAALLFCLLVVVVVLMSRYHRRKAQQMTQKYEEELTLTRENSIRRLHSHHTDPRSQPEESVGLRAEGHPDSSLTPEKY